MDKKNFLIESKNEMVKNIRYDLGLDDHGNKWVNTIINEDKSLKEHGVTPLELKQTIIEAMKSVIREIEVMG